MVQRRSTSLGVEDPWLKPLDRSQRREPRHSLLAVRSSLISVQIDFLVHSIAFADKDWLQAGKFAATPREVFNQAMDISAYTYAAMANRAADRDDRTAARCWQ